MKASGFTDKLTEAALKSNNLKKFMDSGEKFDLVVIESLLNDAHLGFAHYFNAPFVVLSPSGGLTANHMTGNPAPFSFVPNMHLPTSSNRLTFSERLTNTFLGLTFNAWMNYLVFPKQNEIYRNFFGADAPDLRDVITNVSLVLVNSHVCLETPRPYLPNMITIGGYHVEEPKELPKVRFQLGDYLEFQTSLFQDIKTILDNAKEGAIYFSLGSLLKSAKLPQEKREAMLEAFKKLPYKILWKFEDENLPGKPENVFIKKWYPQRDVLGKCCENKNS